LSKKIDFFIDSFASSLLVQRVENHASDQNNSQKKDAAPNFRIISPTMRNISQNHGSGRNLSNVPALGTDAATLAQNQSIPFSSTTTPQSQTHVLYNASSLESQINFAISFLTSFTTFNLMPTRVHARIASFVALICAS
jgi:hypothetical protein